MYMQNQCKLKKTLAGICSVSELHVSVLDPSELAQGKVDDISQDGGKDDCDQNEAYPVHGCGSYGFCSSADGGLAW